jgi:hypothetical protein
MQIEMLIGYFLWDHHDQSIFQMDESPTKQSRKRQSNSPAEHAVAPSSKRQATGGIAPSGLGMFAAGDVQNQTIAFLKPPPVAGGEADMNFVTPLSSPTKASAKDTPNMVFILLSNVSLIYLVVE